MCGRFALAADGKTLKDVFRIPKMLIEVRPNYNIAPQSYIPTVLKNPEITMKEMKWGFVPSWSREPKVKFSNINVRSETASTSAVYRASFAARRCLIPASGFYEWKVRDDGTKEALYIHPENSTLITLAGLYDIWKDVEGKEFWSCAIMTTQANDLIRPVHERMPVIIDTSDYDIWLNQDTDQSRLFALIAPRNTPFLTLESGTRFLRMK